MDNSSIKSYVIYSHIGLGLKSYNFIGNLFFLKDTINYLLFLFK